MKERIPFLAGVIYVATFLALATFCCPAPVDSPCSQERGTHKLVREGRGSDRLSQRLSRPLGMPEAPEYVNGKPLKYRTCKTRVTTEEAATEYPKNCLIIWTADWCSRCPRMKELGERLKAEGYDVFYIDYDKNKAKAREEGVKAVPTAIIHSGGEEVHRVVGISANNQRSVEAEIRKILRKNDVPDEYEIY